MAEPQSQQLTLEDAQKIVAEVGRDGSDAARLRAAFRVIDQNAVKSVEYLPPPMDDVEVIERTARLLRGIGKKLTQLSYKRAFRLATDELIESKPRMNAQQVQATERFISNARLPRTLKGLYKQFPEIKRNGFPPGFPAGKGPLEIQRWCQMTARKILATQEHEKMDALTDKEVAERDAAQNKEVPDALTPAPSRGTEGEETSGEGIPGEKTPQAV